VLLAFTVAVLFLLSLMTARGFTAFDPAWWAMLATEPGLAQTVFLEIRLPRAALGLAVGFALGVAGAVMQGLLRNPLADPGIVGTSGGAALGAVVVFYFGFAGSTPLALPLGGLAGAALALGLLFAMAGWAAPTLTLILAGIAVAALSGALTSLALNLAPSPFAAFEIVSWSLGSLTDRSLDHVWLAVPLMAAGCALLLLLRRPLDALTLGEDTAATLGVAVGRVRFLAVAGVAVAVGAAVSVTGVIGFIGLVAPHLVRPFCGQSPGATLLPAGLAGAALLLSADVLVRLIPVGPELKLGVVTALVGAPFFLRLVSRTRMGRL
jgi:iron complex transport system permease protein